MKMSISASIMFVFLSFICAVFFSIIFFEVQISKANDFHYAMCYDIESSDYSSKVIEQYTKQNDYKVSIKPIEKNNEMRLYSTVTEKKISIPLFNFSKSYKKESYGR